MRFLTEKVLYVAEERAKRAVRKLEERAAAKEPPRLEEVLHEAHLAMDEGEPMELPMPDDVVELCELLHQF